MKTSVDHKTFKKLLNLIDTIYNDYGLSPFHIKGDMGIDEKVLISASYRHGLLTKLNRGIYCLKAKPTHESVLLAYEKFRQENKLRTSHEIVSPNPVYQPYTLQQCIERLRELGYTGEIKPIIKDSIKF